jgi:hypothetical protein
VDAKRLSAIMQWHADKMKEKSLSLKSLLSNSTDTRLNRLMRIQGYYRQVWTSMVPHIRKEFEHLTPDQIKFLISAVDAYIDNLIRLGENGQGKQITILDVIFDGSEEQFDYYFGEDENEFRRITKNIILDLHNYIKQEKKENESVFMKENTIQ